MKSLPSIWKQEELKMEVSEADNVNAFSPELKIRDITGEAGSQAGLVGLDSTFTFSPRDFRDGKLLSL